MQKYEWEGMKQDSAWRSASCCGDSDVDDVSKGSGGGSQERREKGEAREMVLTWRFAMCRKESVPKSKSFCNPHVQCKVLHRGPTHGQMRGRWVWTSLKRP